MSIFKSIVPIFAVHPESQFEKNSSEFLENLYGDSCTDLRKPQRKSPNSALWEQIPELKTKPNIRIYSNTDQQLSTILQQNPHLVDQQQHNSLLTPAQSPAPALKPNIEAMLCVAKGKSTISDALREILKETDYSSTKQQIENNTDNEKTNYDTEYAQQDRQTNMYQYNPANDFAWMLYSGKCGVLKQEKTNKNETQTNHIPHSSLQTLQDQDQQVTNANTNTNESDNSPKTSFVNPDNQSPQTFRHHQSPYTSLTSPYSCLSSYGTLGIPNSDIRYRYSNIQESDQQSTAQYTSSNNKLNFFSMSSIPSLFQQMQEYDTTRDANTNPTIVTNANSSITECKQMNESKQNKNEENKRRVMSLKDKKILKKRINQENKIIMKQVKDMDNQRRKEEKIRKQQETSENNNENKKTSSLLSWIINNRDSDTKIKQDRQSKIYRILLLVSILVVVFASIVYMYPQVVDSVNSLLVSCQFSTIFISHENSDLISHIKNPCNQYPNQQDASVIQTSQGNEDLNSDDLIPLQIEQDEVICDSNQAEQYIKEQQHMIDDVNESEQGMQNDLGIQYKSNPDLQKTDGVVNNINEF